MSWLLIIILAYLFFSFSSLGDKLVLSATPKPKLYVFYVGMLGLVVVFLMPFAGGMALPTAAAAGWISLAAINNFLALYFMFSAMQKFEASRVMPAIGAIQSILILLLTWVFWGFEAVAMPALVAFFLLLLGSFVISVEKKFSLTREFLTTTLVAAALFACGYIFFKMVFLHLPFLQGLIWISIATALCALSLLFEKDFRYQLFEKREGLDKKTGRLFLFAQFCGGAGTLLQSLAIALAPIGYLAIINALRGLQYVFLFVLMLAASRFLPPTAREEISKKIIIQKTAAMALIVFGLAMLFAS